jgi:hypothetical protein
MCLSATMIGWMFDTTYYAFSFGMPIPGNSRAGYLSVNGEMFTLGDFETVVDGVSSGAASSGDFEAGITYANNIFKPFNDELGDKVHLDLGLTVSYAQARMGEFTASELTFDTGMNFSCVLPNLTDLLTFDNSEDNVASTDGSRSGNAALSGTQLGGADASISSQVYENSTSGNVNLPAPAKADTFTVGFAFKSLGVMLKPFVDGGVIEAPWTFDFGFLYTLIGDARHKIDLTTAIHKPSDSGIQVMSGLQYVYKNTIFLRGGYKYVGRDYEDFSFGVGLNFELTEKLVFQADYTMAMLATWVRQYLFDIGIVIIVRYLKKHLAG